MYCKMVGIGSGAILKGKKCIEKLGRANHSRAILVRFSIFSVHLELKVLFCNGVVLYVPVRGRCHMK